MARRLTSIIGLAATMALVGCNEPEFTPTQVNVIKSLSLAALPPLPADPSNRVADDPRAVSLGKMIFFDPGMSPSGQVACATCHVPERQFQDDLPLAHGVGVTNRRAMPLAGTAWSPWQFWDGRKDSQWSQVLGPLESAVEHGGTRAFYARRTATAYRREYEALFGPLPIAADLPNAAGPIGTEAEKAAWDALGAERQDQINRIFANLGKAIAAFERTIPVAETRFDRFAAALVSGKKPEGSAVLSKAETNGLKLFISKGQCINCHNGPRFTDDHFHNTGVAQPADLPQDRGRADAIAQLDADPFNCLGPYSDAKPDQCGELKFMARDTHQLERAFKPPSLRGVATRPPYMHSGQVATLEAVVDHYSAAPAAPSGHSELQQLNLTGAEKADLIAFLKTLEP